MNTKGTSPAWTIILIILAVLLVLSTVALVVIGNFFYNFALNPNSSFAFVPTPEIMGNDAGTPSGGDGLSDSMTWLTEHAALVSLTSGDGLRLSAYARSRADNHRYVVICHGYTSYATQAGGFAKRFYEMGYNILVPDARGHGLSEGDYIGMGWHERRDVVDWCKQLVAQDPLAEIALFGISMGAATVMMASGEADLPAQVKAVVEDCGYTSVWDEFAGQLKSLYKLPAFPILNATSLVAQVRAGYNFKEASAVEQLKKSVTPTLFIHGDKDVFVPFWMLDEVYQAANVEKEQLVIPGAGHTQASYVAPALYWSRVEAFLNRFISGTSD